MLRISNDAKSWQLPAGEPFIAQLQLLGADGKAIDIDDHAMVLSLYSTSNRQVLVRLQGERTSDAAGELFEFVRDGTFSEDLLGKALAIELSRRFKNGREIIVTAKLDIASSAAEVPSLDNGPIGVTATRITLKVGATPAATPTFTISYLPWGTTLDVLDAILGNASTILAGDTRPVNGQPLNAQLAAIAAANTAHAAGNADHAARLAALGVA